MTCAFVPTALLALAPENVWRLGVWWGVVEAQLKAGISSW